ncbi:MAG: hypothetical protein FWD19_03315, partial [Defluviitaleaceae bacterium]|nr:hypothetical protein [Defluviitaleaceae bacterium]
MKADKTVNFLMYLAGMAFNVTVMALVGFFVLTAFNRGFQRGEEFAEDMVYVGEDEKIEFHVSRNTSVSEMAQRLERDGIIPNKLLFQLELHLRNATHDFTE